MTEVNMKKKFGIVLCIVCFFLISACVFAACDNATDNPITDDNTSYSIKVEKTDDFADYYTINTDYSLVSSGKTVTVTVNAWNFLKVNKVYANDEICTATEDGKYSFTMPKEDVVVKAEFKVESVPETEDGLKWTNYDAIAQATSLSSGIHIDFGVLSIQNTVYANEEGYSTMYYAKVLSTNQDVVPNDAIRRIEPETGGNGAYAIGAWISFDLSKVKAGRTTLIFIDTDNERAITAEIYVIK